MIAAVGDEHVEKRGMKRRHFAKGNFNWGPGETCPSPCLLFFFAKKFFTEAMSGGQMADGEIGRGYVEGSSKTAFAFWYLYLRRPPGRRTSEDTSSPVSQRCITYLRGGENLLHYTPTGINKLQQQR